MRIFQSCFFIYFILFFVLIPSFGFSQNILILDKTSSANFFENSKYIIRIGQKIKVVTAEKEFEGKVSEIADSAIFINDTSLSLSAISKIGIVTFGKIITVVFIGVPVFLAGLSVFFAATLLAAAGISIVSVGLLYDDTIIFDGVKFLGAAFIGYISGCGIAMLSADHLLKIRKQFDTIKNWKISVKKG